jgi:NADH oxidase (H2O2-forming)
MTDLKTDILLVGGGPGGFIISVTAATCWPEKKITVVRPEEKSLIPCGIPYISGTLGGIEEDLLYGSREFRATGALNIDRVVSVEGRQQLALLKSGKRIRWDRLVISMGEEPIMPPLPGANLVVVFTIHKEYDYMDHFFNRGNNVRVEAT